MLEGLASRVDIVQSTDFDDHLQGALSNLRVLVHAPLTSELCQFLVVFAKDHLKCPLGKFLTRLYHHTFLDEQAQSSNDGLVLDLWVAEHSRNHETDRVVITLLLACFYGRHCTAWSI